MCCIRHRESAGRGSMSRKTLPLRDYASFEECRRVADYKFAFMLQFHDSPVLKFSPYNSCFLMQKVALNCGSGLCKITSSLTHSSLIRKKKRKKLQIEGTPHN